MGINYWLLNKEKKEEERRARLGGREQKSNRDNVAKLAEARTTEDTV